MPSYTTNIPQGTNNISTSQGQILQNFQVLDSGATPVYTGFTKEHITMTDVTDGGLHKQVTMFNVASIVAPAAGYARLYASKTGSFGAATTELIAQNGDSSALGVVGAIKAWGVFGVASGGPTTMQDSFNCTVAWLSTGVYQVTFSVAMPSTLYSVLVSSNFTITASAPAICSFYSRTLNGFQIQTSNTSGAARDATPVSFMVLQS